MVLTAVDEDLGGCFFGIMPENIAGFRADDLGGIFMLAKGWVLHAVPNPSRSWTARGQRQ